MKMKEFIIGQNEENRRLDKFLKTVLPKAPDSFIYKMLRKKNIKLNDGKATGAEKLSLNDVVRIYFSDETFDSFAASPVAASDNEYTLAFKKLKGISVVYEDDDILVNMLRCLIIRKMPLKSCCLRVPGDMKFLLANTGQMIM